MSDNAERSLVAEVATLKQQLHEALGADDETAAPEPAPEPTPTPAPTAPARSSGGGVLSGWADLFSPDWD